MRAAAEHFACLACGIVLGADSLQLADTAWSAYIEDLTREGGAEGIRLRVVKTFDAICPHCGTHHKFIPKERSFILAR